MRIEDEVLGLEVSVYNFVPVEVLESYDDVGDEEFGLLFVEVLSVS